MKQSSKKTKTKKEKPFSKLSKPEKRVAIAKDVLEQLKLKIYTADSGRYVAYLRFIDTENYPGKNEDIKTNFDKIQHCYVCAMGACLMSATKFANKLNFSDIGSTIGDLRNEKVKKLFSSIFDPKQLLMIEIAFEGDTMRENAYRIGYEIFNVDNDNDLRHSCHKFYRRYEENDEERLIAIMKNIIKNKGEFKP